jgi:putative DNA methylase
MPYRKKLIEVALPLEAINTESAREKPIRFVRSDSSQAL